MALPRLLGLLLSLCAGLLAPRPASAGVPISFSGDIYDLSIQFVCPEDGTAIYMAIVDAQPAPCLGMTWDGQSESCGTDLFTGRGLEVREQQVVNGTTDISVSIHTSDGSALLPPGMTCTEPDQFIDVLRVSLGKPDSGGPGLEGDKLDPGLTPSPTEILRGEVVVYGTGGVELLRTSTGQQGQFVVEPTHTFDLFGAGQVPITGIGFEYTFDGVPDTNGNGHVLFPDGADIPSGQSQTFFVFDCSAGGGDFGPDGVPGTADDACTPAPSDFTLLGDIGTISDDSGDRTQLDADLPEGQDQGEGALVANPPGQVQIEAPLLVIGTTGLQVIKTPERPRVGLGDLIVYTIQVLAGPMGADTVRVNDFLPANGEVYESLVAPGWTCELDHPDLSPGSPIPPLMPGDPRAELVNWSEPHLHCTLDGSLVPFDTAPPITLTIRARNTPGFPVNRATASSPSGGFAEGHAEVEVTDEVDLAASKQAQPDPVEADQLLRYTIVVDNVGLNPSQDIEVLDTLPPGYQVVGQEGSSHWTCDPQSGQTVRCRYDDVVPPGGSTAPLVLVVQPAEDAASGVSINTVEVSDTAAGDDDDFAEAPVTVVPVADIFVVKEADRSQVRVDTGDPLDRRVTYTIRVHNIGPGPAENVLVLDVLPPGVIFVSGPPNCVHQDGIVTCILDEIPAPPGNNVKEVDIIVEVDPATLGQTHCNEASVTTSSVDRFPSNDTSDPVCVRAVPTVEVSLAKTRITTATQVAVPIFYEITVHNPSATVPAEDVVVTDLLPPNVANVSASSSQGICDVQLASDRIVCDIGTLAPGQTVTVTVQMTPLSPGQLCNTATVAADALPPGGEAPQVCDDIEFGPDVTILKDFIPDPADPVLRQGVVFEVQLVAINGGTGPVENVQISDTLPPGVSFVGFTAGSATCQEVGGTVSCDVGTLAPGESFTVRFAVRYSGSGQLCNDARVTTSTVQPTENDVTQTCDDFAPSVDLNLVKTGPPRFVGLGQRFDYTLEVTNPGPGDATGVQIVDLVPAGLSLVSASYSLNGGPDQPCADQGGDAVCDVGAMAEGDRVIVTVTVDSVAEGEACDRGDVTAAQFERNIEDNTSEYCNEVVTGLADLEVVKFGPGVLPVLGEPFTYTVEVTNRGPDTATGVVMEDVLPFELGFDGASFGRSGDPPGTAPTACGFDPASRRVSCDVGALAPGEVATVTIQVVPQFADVEFCNEASGDLNEFDPDTTNNVSPAVGEAPLCLTAAGDRDGDGIIDPLDNCPDFANPDQTDTDDNDIGNECECGDQNEDGTVDVRDILQMSRVIFGIEERSELGETNGDGQTNIIDILGANDKIFKRGEQYCPPRTAPPPGD